MRHLRDDTVLILDGEVRVYRRERSKRWQAAEARELKVGTNIWPGYEPLYFAANHMPDFGSADIDIQRFFNASEVSSAFEIGLIDVAALTLDEAVMIADKGLDISVIAVMDVSYGADKVCITLTDFDVKDAKVAYEESALGGYFLSKFLEYSGSELKDFASPVSLPVDTHLEAIQQNTVNTFVTFEPFSTYLKAEGCQQVYNSSMDPDVIIDVLVLNNEQLAFGDVSREQVEALVKAWFWALSKVAATVRSDLYEGAWLAAPHIDGNYDTENGISIQSGFITLPKGPGLGVVPDLEHFGDPVASFGV